MNFRTEGLKRVARGNYRPPGQAPWGPLGGSATPRSTGHSTYFADVPNGDLGDPQSRGPRSPRGDGNAVRNAPEFRLSKRAPITLRIKRAAQQRRFLLRARDSGDFDHRGLSLVEPKDRCFPISGRVGGSAAFRCRVTRHRPIRPVPGCDQLPWHRRYVRLRPRFGRAATSSPAIR